MPTCGGHQLLCPDWPILRLLAVLVLSAQLLRLPNQLFFFLSLPLCPLFLSSSSLPLLVLLYLISHLLHRTYLYSITALCHCINNGVRSENFHQSFRSILFRYLLLQVSSRSSRWPLLRSFTGSPRVISQGLLFRGRPREVLFFHRFLLGSWSRRRRWCRCFLLPERRSVRRGQAKWSLPAHQGRLPEGLQRDCRKAY